MFGRPRRALLCSLVKYLARTIVNLPDSRGPPQDNGKENGAKLGIIQGYIGIMDKKWNLLFRVQGLGDFGP